MIASKKEVVLVWNESDRMSLRSEFVRLATMEGANRRQLCKRFRILRNTGHKWLKVGRSEATVPLSGLSSSESAWRTLTMPGWYFQVDLGVTPAWGVVELCDGWSYCRQSCFE